MTITGKQLAQLSKPGRYRDERGLYVQISDTGARHWVLRYERADHRPGRQGKRRERWMSLGPVGDIDPVEARELARLARNQLRDGIDPIETRKADRSKRALASESGGVREKS
jgi:hypothetical protein